MTDQELGKDLTCFIVGPIGDRLEPPGTPGRMRYEDATQMWANVFEPSCEVFGLAPVRADKIAESGEIPEQIFTYLRDADIVITDLTGGNANVMYELGLRHTRDKITIQVGEHERLPFDVNTIRTVKFKRTEAGLIDARNGLIEALRTALLGNGEPVTATRVWAALGGLSPQDVAAASALSFITDDPADMKDTEAPGQLELLAQGEEAIGTLEAILSDFSSHFEEMSAVTDELTPRMTAAESFAIRLTIMKQIADRLKEPSSKMDVTSGDFFTRVEQVDGMMTIVFNELRADPQVIDSEGVEGFPGAVIGLGDAAEEASVSFTETLQVVREMRKWSKLLAPLSKSMEHSLNRILRGNSIVSGWAAQMRDLTSGDGGEGAVQ